MVIDPSEPQIFEWSCAHYVDELLPRRIDTELAARDLLEQIVELFV